LPSRENKRDISKYRPISSINSAAKVLEKVRINRIMHHTEYASESGDLETRFSFIVSG
jgi:hypothetical protein